MLNLPVKIFLSFVVLFFCGALSAEDTEKSTNYERSSVGTRQFEWGPEDDPVWAKVLVEESILGTAGAEVVEVYFPPDYESRSHFHELEILYIIEGELEHIVDGESHVLTPGMIGIVQFPDQVIHKTLAEDGARVLVIWPLGNEVKGFDGMTEKPIE
jgi:quercetin dioxygenase-like cupin family protein